MSVPVATANTPTITGAPGSYVLNYSWSGTNTPTSYTVSLYQVIQSVTTVATTLTATVLTSSTYSNLVTGASYYSIVTATNGTGTSSPVTSSSVSFYNPFGGPQGVQGVQGIAGANGEQGPPGPQGVQGLQGLVNFSGPGAGNISNYLITTSGNPGTINANSGLTWNGETLNVSGSSANGVITASANSSLIGGVRLQFNNIVAADGTITTLAAGSNSVGGVTLSNSRVSASSTSAHNLGLVTFTNGAITGVTTINASTIGGVGISAGALTGVTTINASTIGGVAISAGALTGVTTINASTIGGVAISAGALTGVTTINASTIGGVAISAGAISGATTISNSGSTTSGSFSTAGAITTGNLTSNFVGGVVLWNGILSNSTAGASLTITGPSTGVFPTLTVLPPSNGGFTISATGINRIGGATISAAGALSDVTTISNSGSTTSGSFSTAGTITAPSINNGASTFTVTGTSGSNINTLTVGVPATALCNAIFTTGTIEATSTLAHKMGPITLSNGALIGVSSICNAAGASIAAIGTASRPVTNIYATGVSNVTSINTMTVSGCNVSGMGTVGCGAITGTSSISASNGFFTAQGSQANPAASVNYLIGTFSNQGTIIYTVVGSLHDVNGQLCIYKVGGNWQIANTQWFGGSTQVAITCNLGINYTIYAYANSAQTYMNWNLTLFPAGT